MDPQTLLIEAKSRIENPDAWYSQGNENYVHGSHAVCTYIAFMFAYENYGLISSDTNVNTARKALFEAIGVSHPMQVYSWNDEPGRTHADVLNAFDKAIASFEEAK